MSLTDVIVVVQMATFAALAILFLRDHPALAIAQICYLVATAALFLGKT